MRLKNRSLRIQPLLGLVRFRMTIAHLDRFQLFGSHFLIRSKKAGISQARWSYRAIWKYHSPNKLLILRGGDSQRSQPISLDVTELIRTFFLLALGIGFEEPLGAHLRWRQEGSGSVIPHHGTIWACKRISQFHELFELVAGYSTCHFKGISTRR